MLTHVFVHGEHDQFNDAHEHELHIGRLTEKSTHGYQRCGNCNIRAEQTENDHVSRSICLDMRLSLLTGYEFTNSKIRIRNMDSRFRLAI